MQQNIDRPADSSLSPSLDVRALPGLHSRACEHLRQAGITSIDQIVAMQPDDLRQFKGIKTTAEAIHASARAWMEQKPIWYNGLPAPARQGGWIFDIETLPYTDTIWSIGWSDVCGAGKIVLVGPASKQGQIQLPNPLDVMALPTPDDAWQFFAKAVSFSPGPIYHWTGFDAGVMKKRAPAEVWDGLNPRLHDLHHTFNQTVRCPIRNTSLKTVAAYLNFAYSAYERWDLAYHDYLLWLRRGDVDALQRACSYQIDDVKATVLVWGWLAANAPE